MTKKTKAELVSEVERLKALLANHLACETVRSPKDFAKLIKEKIDVSKLEQEHFWVFLLNARQKIIKEILVSKGSLSEVNVHPRDVFREAIRINAHSLLMAHNHPSGDPDPSEADINMTKRMIDAGALIGIPILDHVILTANGHCSIASLGFF